VIRRIAVGAACRLLLVAIVVTASACSTLSPAGPGEVLVHLWNTSETPVGLYVNDQWVGTYPSGAEITAPIAGHGGPPWTVTTKDRANQVVTTATVSADEATSLARGDTVIEASTSLDCGLVRIMVGTTEAVAVSIPQDAAEPDCP
jgi:hypothetical protein